MLGRRETPVDGPSFGILMTVFHRAGFYRDALESVAAQSGSLPPVELVVVSSSDMSVEVPVTLRARGWKCQVLKNDSVGEGPFLAPGLERLGTDFILPLDDDDIWEPGRLAHVADVLRQHPGASYYHNGQSFVDALGAPLPPDRALRGLRRLSGVPQGGLRALSHEDLRRHRGGLSRWGSVFNNSSVAIRRRALTSCLDELSRAEWLFDLFMFYAGVCDGEQVLFDSSPQTRYRIHAWNRSRGAQTLGRFESATPSRSREGRLATLAVLHEMVARRGPSWLLDWVSHDQVYFDALEALREGDSDRLETARRVGRLIRYVGYSDPLMNLVLGLTSLAQLATPQLVSRAYWTKDGVDRRAGSPASEAK